MVNNKIEELPNDNWRFKEAVGSNMLLILNILRRESSPIYIGTMIVKMTSIVREGSGSNYFSLTRTSVKQSIVKLMARNLIARLENDKYVITSLGNKIISLRFKDCRCGILIENWKIRCYYCRERDRRARRGRRVRVNTNYAYATTGSSTR